MLSIADGLPCLFLQHSYNVYLVSDWQL